MREFVLRAAALALALCTLACARTKPMYDRDDLEPPATSQLPPDPVHSVYLVGSAGGVTSLDESPALSLLRRVLAKADTNSNVLFLGDNLAPYGMPSKKQDERYRENAKQQIKTQLEVVEDYPGQVTFLHGDRDWAKYKIEGAERQEDYIEKRVDEEIMLPTNGCGDPVLLEVSDDLGILVINSQWYLDDWDQYQEINEGCEAQSRASFRWRLTNLVKGVRYKHVVVAMHHPVISRGPRGGEHNLKTLFREGNIGPLSAWIRNKIGVKQDLHAPKMQELRDLLRNVFDEHTTVTFASGHEYLLQFGEWYDHPVVGSGTAARTSPGKVGQGTVFTAGRPGFAELHYYADGSSWVRFVEADGSPSGKTLFERQLNTLAEPRFEGDFELYESGRDSFTFAPFADYRKFGPLYKSLFGTNNRELFETAYTYPILRFEDVDGGLTVSQRGGGGQTNSLRLVTADGRDYALRSIRKDPTRLLPAKFRVGPLVTLTQDVFFTANPFGALTAADIAEGVDIPHANPRIYYVPAQPGLGELNAAFAGDLYLLEERPNDEWIGRESPFTGKAPFGEPDDIDGRDDVLRRIREKPDHRMDQRALLRGRLLDVLLGDFDRHDDQWRYAKYEDEETGVKYWRPIPRDRDQALLNIDGPLLRIAGKTLPAVREVQDFGARQPYIEDFTFQARMFDRRFLNELTREDFAEAADELQAKLTDDEIERALDDWPAEARRGRKEEIVAALKQRRDDLDEYARRLYEFQAKSVYVVGTDDDDYFDVERREDGSVRVRVYEMKKGEPVGDPYYERTFHVDETKNIQLFGLREEDRFEVTGKSGNPSIKIRIVPGPERDEVVTTDEASSVRKRTRVYGWPGEDKLDLSRETEAHLTRYTRFNRYDYRDVNYDYGLWLPAAGFNVDDGVRLGLLYQRNHYTYHRRFRQIYKATFATASLGLRLDYNFSVLDVAPRFDVGLDIAYQTPSYAVNFFGRGNETVELPRDELPDGRSFYRIRQELISFYPNVTIRNKNHIGGLTVGVGGESIRLERDLERFLGNDAYPASSPLFERHNYYGAKASYRYANVDKRAFPREGMDFNVSSTLLNRVEPASDVVGSLNASLTVYQHLWRGAVLAMRTGGGVSFGDYFFYQGQTLGAGTLRGYRRERFNGDEQVYQNIDYRQQWKIRKLRSRGGFFVSFDHGRVWLDEGTSDTWHYSYGGGIFLRPLSLFGLSVGYYIPEDESTNVVRVVAGFDF